MAGIPFVLRRLSRTLKITANGGTVKGCRPLKVRNGHRPFPLLILYLSLYVNNMQEDGKDTTFFGPIRHGRPL